MNRLPALSLLVSAALVVLAPAADAKPRLHTDVTIRNATGSTLRGARLIAWRANGHKLTVDLEAIRKGAKRVVRVNGTAHGWGVGGGYARCTTHQHHKISCVVRDYATGAKRLPDSLLHPVPDPAPAPAPAPAP